MWRPCPGDGPYVDDFAPAMTSPRFLNALITWFATPPARRYFLRILGTMPGRRDAGRIWQDAVIGAPILSAFPHMDDHAPTVAEPQMLNVLIMRFAALPTAITAPLLSAFGIYGISSALVHLSSHQASPLGVIVYHDHVDAFASRLTTTDGTYEALDLADEDLPTLIDETPLDHLDFTWSTWLAESARWCLGPGTYLSVAAWTTHLRVLWDSAGRGEVAQAALTVMSTDTADRCWARPALRFIADACWSGPAFDGRLHLADAYAAQPAARTIVLATDALDARTQVTFKSPA